MKRILLALLLISSLASAQTNNFKWISQQTYVATGTNTYAITIPGYAANTIGSEIKVLFTNGNTGSSTLQIGALAAVTLRKNGSSALSSGDLLPGATYRLTFDGTFFQVLGIGGSGGGSTSWASITGKPDLIELPAAPTAGEDGFSVKWNDGLGAWEYYSTLLTDGNATTANGMAVDWGGTVSNDISIDGGNAYSIAFNNLNSLGLGIAAQNTFSGTTGNYTFGTNDVFEGYNGSDQYVGRQSVRNGLGLRFNYLNYHRGQNGSNFQTIIYGVVTQQDDANPYDGAFRIWYDNSNSAIGTILSGLNETSEIFGVTQTGALEIIQPQNASSGHELLLRANGSNLRAITKLGIGSGLSISGGNLVASGTGATNLAFTPSSTNGIVTSDTGTDATIPLGNGTNSGLSLNDYTTAEKSKLAAITGTNTGDVSLAGTPDYITISGQTITRGLIDLATDVTGTLPSGNGGNATHTGDVTGATALTIANGAVDIPMLSATGTPSATTFLRGDNTWATPGGGGGATITDGSSSFTVGSSQVTLSVPTFGTVYEAGRGYIRMTDAGVGSYFAGPNGNGSSGVTYFQSGNITSGTGTAKAADTYFTGGNGVVSNFAGGDARVYGGSGSGSGADGDVRIADTNQKLTFFEGTPVVKQSAVTTAQGIADVLTAYGLLPTSTISGGGGSGLTYAQVKALKFK